MKTMTRLTLPQELAATLWRGKRRGFGLGAVPGVVVILGTFGLRWL